MIPAFEATYAASGICADRAQAHHRRDVDDRAAAVRAHPARGQAGERERRRQVDVEHARERLGARLQRGRGGADAGVVDEPVEAPVALHDGLDEPLALARVGHVAGDGVDARQLALQPREPVGPPRGEHRDRAGGRQRAGELLAEAGAGAGDDDDLSSSESHLNSVQFYHADCQLATALAGIAAAAGMVHPTSTSRRKPCLNHAKRATDDRTTAGHRRRAASARRSSRPRPSCSAARATSTASGPTSPRPSASARRRSTTTSSPSSTASTRSWPRRSRPRSSGSTASPASTRTSRTRSWRCCRRRSTSRSARSCATACSSPSRCWSACTARPRARRRRGSSRASARATSSSSGRRS